MTKPCAFAWKFSPLANGLFVVVGLLMLFAFWNGFERLIHAWGSDEYSHGYFIPLVAMFLVWQQRTLLACQDFTGAWIGPLVVLFGLFIYLVGTFGTIYMLVHYSLIVVLFGLMLSFTGWRPMAYLWPALLFLVFMIPFPPFLYNQMSLGLQLISSEIGVAVIRLFGITVFLEGNVIDLGSYKLQVVDACSGLRYLFPLMSFGFLIAYFFQAPLWQRLLVFFSTIPITVLMNSFRIGVIGVMVEYFGIEHAEGFLHEFEGWVIFMACTVILLAEVWLLARFSRPRRSFWEAFALDFPTPLPADLPRQVRPVPLPFIAAVVLFAIAAVATPVIGARPAVELDRTSFAVFPDQVGTWDGRKGTLEERVLDTLDLDDYYIADFITQGTKSVNFYVAFYGSQQAGAAAHSPRSCIPGGGWKITSLSTKILADVEVQGRPLRINRLQIQRGDDKQLVYYWFQQRHRLLTNEYAVKWFLFWDALTLNRTDGALIRLTTAIQPWEDWAQGDERLAEFAREVNPRLTPFLPD